MNSFTVDKSSPVPYYYQIEEWIRGQIASGKLKPGDMLTNEIRLSEQLGVSRMTVRQALNHLSSEGIITRQRAKGTFITPPRSPVPISRDRLSSMTEELSKEGKKLYSQVLDQELQPAIGEIRTQLGLQEGEQVILIRRLRGTEDCPLSIETVYHPYSRFPELLTMEVENTSIYEILERVYQARPAEAIDTVFAGIASEDEAALLGMHKGEPVMHFKRVSWDEAGQAIEFTRAVYRADRYQFVIRYHRSEPEGN
jgi:GntR family transcriptional regulator